MRLRECSFVSPLTPPSYRALLQSPLTEKATLKRQKGIPNTQTRQPEIYRLPRDARLRLAQTPLLPRTLRRYRIKPLFHYFSAHGAVRMRGDQLLKIGQILRAQDRPQIFHVVAEFRPDAEELAVGVEKERLIDRTMIYHRRRHLPITGHLPEIGVMVRTLQPVEQERLHVVGALWKEFEEVKVARLPHCLVTAQVIEFDNQISVLWGCDWSSPRKKCGAGFQPARCRRVR